MCMIQRLVSGSLPDVRFQAFALNIAVMMKTLAVAYLFIIINIFADRIIYSGGSVIEKIKGLPSLRRWALYFALVLIAFFMFLHGNGGYGNAQQFIYFQF